MYIVWKKRRLKYRYCTVCKETAEGPIYAFIPMLVESRRVKGKPRQVHIARFCSIRSCCLRSAKVREAWWELIEKSLRRLRKKEAEDVRAKLAARAPKPTAEELAKEAASKPPPGCPSYLWSAVRGFALSWPCSLSEVKASFRVLAKKHHPDHGGNAAEFRRVYREYETLRAFLGGS